jgi:hypothetical protein
MKQFIEYILQFRNLNQQQLDLISKKGTERILQKDEYFFLFFIYLIISIQVLLPCFPDH